MSDAQRRQITLQLAQHNLRRAEDNLPPMSFDDFVDAGGGGAQPASPQPPAQAPPADSSPPAKRLPTYNPKPSSPAPNPTPGLSVVPGAKPEKVTPQKYGRGGGHSYQRSGRGGGSGGGSEKDAGFQIDAINRANNMARDAEEEAAKLEDRGFKDQAQKMRDKAARYRQTGDQVRARARKNPHVVLNDDGSAAAGTQPKVKLPGKFRITW
jgi:hypothetical protein